MIGKHKLVSAIFASLIIAFTTASQAQNRKVINEEEAIRISEKFIIDNGYTDLPPSSDKRDLVYETVERSSNPDEIFKERSNTLEKKAYGIFPKRTNGKPGWSIVFRRTYRCNECKYEIGRAVSMDPDGKNIRMEHKPFPLANVSKKLG